MPPGSPTTFELLLPEYPPLVSILSVSDAAESCEALLETLPNLVSHDGAACDSRQQHKTALEH